MNEVLEVSYDNSKEISCLEVLRHNEGMEDGEYEILYELHGEEADTMWEILHNKEYFKDVYDRI